MEQGEYIELTINEHQEHDGYMPNVYPPRKMFSSRPVTKENNPEQGTDMRAVKKMAKYIKDRPLQNQKLMKSNGKGGREFDREAASKYL